MGKAGCRHKPPRFGYAQKALPRSRAAGKVTDFQPQDGRVHLPSPDATPNPPPRQGFSALSPLGIRLPNPHAARRGQPSARRECHRNENSRKNHSQVPGAAPPRLAPDACSPAPQCEPSMKHDRHPATAGPSKAEQTRPCGSATQARPDLSQLDFPVMMPPARAPSGPRIFLAGAARAAVRAPPPVRHVLRSGCFPGGRLLPTALQLGLGLPGYLPRASRPGGPFLRPRIRGFEAARLRGQRVSERPGVFCPHLALLCSGLAGPPEPDLTTRQRVLPGVHLGTPGPAR